MRNAYFSFSNAVNKNVKQIFCLSVALSFIWNVALGQTPEPTSTPEDLSRLPDFQVQEIQKSASNGQYQIGDRIPLAVEIKADNVESGESLNLKLPEGTTKLEDLGWYLDPSTQFVGRSFRFLAAPIQTGKLTLPVLLVMKANDVAIGKTTPYTIQVSGPAEAKDKQGAELIDPSSVGLAAKYWILFSLAGVAILALIGLGIRKYLKTRTKAKPTVVPVVVHDPLHITAMKKIDNLYRTYPFTLDNLKPISFGVSEILKEFFSKRFQVEAQESTTDEMIELLRKQALSGENLREIQTLFSDLDLVKFTKSENYTHFDEDKYNEFKVKANLIIQKWAVRVHQSEVRPT